MLKRLFMLGAAAASAGAAIGFSRARTEYRTWGIDPADVAKELPGDDIVPEAEAVDTRSLDIAAPPKDVWPVEAQAETAKGANGGIADASSNVRATGLYLDRTMQGDFRASWAFVLEATPGGGTRLIERFRGHMAPAPAVEGSAQPARMPPRFAGTMLLFGLFVMVRRQLQGIRDRAEGRPISPSWFASILPKAPGVS
jgi:hypothetical protein